jgi:hypothetical protein
VEYLYIEVGCLLDNRCWRPNTAHIAEEDGKAVTPFAWIQSEFGWNLAIMTAGFMIFFKTYAFARRLD